MRSPFIRSPMSRNWPQPMPEKVADVPKVVKIKAPKVAIKGIYRKV